MDVVYRREVVVLEERVLEENWRDRPGGIYHEERDFGRQRIWGVVVRYFVFACRWIWIKWETL